MFIRILRDTDEGQHDSLHECQRVNIHPGDQDYCFFLVLEGTGPVFNIQIDKREKITVYAMNDCGKTIDTIFNYRHHPPF